jgi:hypothetical protein
MSAQQQAVIVVSNLTATLKFFVMARLFFIFPLTLLLTNHTFGQESKDLKISIGVGLFNSTYYTNAKDRQAINLSMEYLISKKHSISSDYLSGKHRYYDNINSNNAVPLTTPGYEKNTNATAEYSVFSALYKYQLISKKRLSIKAGLGLGIMTQVVIYPYTTVTIAGPDILEKVDFLQSSWTDMCFPIRAEFDYLVSKKVQIGVISGLYIHPDYPILGQHLAIRFSYILK